MPPAAQTVLIGAGSLGGLGGLVARLGAGLAMLVTGGDAYARSGAQAQVEPALAGLDVVRLAGVAANPTRADIEGGVSLWRMRRPGLVVAVGGGSVIDAGKLIGLLGPSTDPDRTTVIAIPTTAGSGAEATRFATFYDGGEKRSLLHPRLRPAHAIVDSRLTASLSPAVAASTALDALAQAIESLWAVGATAESRDHAEAALRDILPCLDSLVRAPDAGLRERMARGAHLAGRAIDLSRTTAAHALSYALTADLGVAHGHAAALVLPAILRINARPGARPILHPRGRAGLAETMARILGLLGCRDAEDGGAFLEHLVARLGLATRLVARQGCSASSLAGKVDAERLGNNPVGLSREDVLGIYATLLGSAAAQRHSGAAA